MTATEDERMLRPKRRAWPVVVGLIVAALLVLAGGALVLGDVVARPAIERVVADQLMDALPPGSSRPDVQIVGAPLALQLLDGALDRVEITDLMVGVEGGTVDAVIALEGVPIDREQPVRAASGTLSIDETVLNALVKPGSASSPMTIGEGTVRYERELDVAGFTVAVGLTLRPELADGLVTFVPESVDAVGATGLGGRLDLERLVDLTGFAFDICVAEHLPAGVDLTALRVAPGGISADLVARDLHLNSTALANTGACTPETVTQ